MKKVAVILVLHIYLFSLVGQLIVYNYLNYKADQFFTAQTGKGLYKTDELVEVKIPVNISIASEWSDYQQVSGQVQFANAAYNYVKMRVTRNAIYLMCVPNYKTTRLSSQNIIHAEDIGDLKIPAKEHVPYGKAQVIDGAHFVFGIFEFTSPFKMLAIRLVQPVISFNCHKLEIPEQPPKSLS